MLRVSALKNFTGKYNSFPYYFLILVFFCLKNEFSNPQKSLLGFALIFCLYVAEMRITWYCINMVIDYTKD